MDSSRVSNVEGGHRGGEDSIEVGSSKREVNEGIEEVPGKEYPGLRGRFRREESEGETAGGNDKAGHGAQCENAFVVEYRGCLEIW